MHCSAAFALEAAAGGACEGLVEFKTRGVNMIKVSVRGGDGGGGRAVMTLEITKKARKAWVVMANWQ